MAEALSDWKVQVTLNKTAIVLEITKLAELLARERIYYTVAASSRDNAMEKTLDILQRIGEVHPRYVRSLDPRKLPT